MTNIQITSCQVYLVSGDEKLKTILANAFNGELKINSLRLYEGGNGLFLAYPNDPYHKGNDYRQLFYPVSKELRDHIESFVIDRYLKEKGRHDA
jgi:stage V sporulation protein G